MFVLRYTLDRGSGIFTQADQIVVDTIEIADAYRTASVSVKGVTVATLNDRTGELAIHFDGDSVNATDLLETADNAVRRYVDGATVRGNGPFLVVDPSVSADPERFERELTARWD